MGSQPTAIHPSGVVIVESTDTLCHPSVAIIGGGLAGLSLAQQLQDAGIDFQLFESRDRFGGRILTHDGFDLGPSWIWPDDQPLISRFVRRHQLTLIEQWEEGNALFQAVHDAPPQRFPNPGSYAAAYRVQGGSRVLIDTLLKQLKTERLHLNHRLLGLKDHGEYIDLQIETPDGHTRHYQVQQVALMLPPRLLAKQVTFSPALNPELQTTMAETPTWMASHGKAVVQYATPFWREQGLSGSAFASFPGAILGEIFDAGNDEQAALGGFFALPTAMRHQYREDLPSLILNQLMTLFGEAAASPKQLWIQEWSSEKETATEADYAPPNGHPPYAHPFFQLDHWNDRLYFGGSETARAFGGYLEGALQSAHFIAQQIQLSQLTLNQAKAS